MSLWTRLADTAQTISSSLLAFLSGDEKPPEKTVAFTIGMIALSAKMAKSDGVVTHDEVKAFEDVFQVPEKDKFAVERVFNLAKQDIAGFESYANKVAELFSGGAHTLENVLDGLFHIAKADGVVHEQELSYLQRVSEIFGFKEKDFIRIRARHVVIVDDPYVILGLPSDAPVSTVKKQYRKLARELHPDKQVASGMPEELVIIASDRLARINAAYSEIVKGSAA
jgi:DnaJ like chaperone protein